MWGAAIVMTRQALTNIADRTGAGVMASGKCYQVFHIDDTNYTEQPSAEMHHPKNSSVVGQSVE